VLAWDSNSLQRSCCEPAQVSWWMAHCRLHSHDT
jgi:hypothetical protein